MSRRVAWDRVVVRIFAFVMLAVQASPLIAQYSKQRLAVLAADSSFQEARMKLAMHEKLSGHFEEAIRLCYEQVRARPASEMLERELIFLYRNLIIDKGDKKALLWLQSDSSDYGRYFRADLMRRRGRLDEAGRLLQKLLQKRPALPKQLVYLSLLKIHCAQKQPELVAAYFWRAVRETTNMLEADVIFEDVRLVASPEELQTYFSLHSPAQEQAYFHAFWSKRDLTPADAINGRLVEHYRRILEAEKKYTFHNPSDSYSWFNSPNRFRNPFKDISRKADFDDMGRIYIRHGRPDERIVTLIPPSEGNVAILAPIQSWRYRKTGVLPELIFHFALDGRGNWRLMRSMPMNEELLSDLAHFGGLYHRLYKYRNSRHDMIRLKEEIVAERTKDMANGLSHDRPTWETPPQAPSHAIYHRQLSRR